MTVSARSVVQQLQALGVTLTHLVTDSRAVKTGDTFVAYPGEKLDGRQFIAQAIALGANAVIWDSRNFGWNADWNVPHVAVNNLRDAAGGIADVVYGSPSQKLQMIGITGTNGKTSTAHWIASALNDHQKSCALIGTLGNGFVNGLQPSDNTTPDAIRVHGLLADYLHQGARSVAMEVSSHALAQGRVNAVAFDVALLTNLSRDHLDYHGDMQSYADSKRKLFQWDQLKFAVLNLDDALGVELAEQLLNEVSHSPQFSDEKTSHSTKLVNNTSQVAGYPASGRGREREKQFLIPEVVGYGLTDAALQHAERLGIRMVYGHPAAMSGQGLRLEIHSSWGATQLQSPLLGRFNAANLLGALAVLLVSDISLSDAVAALSNVQAVAGRMQRLGNAQQPTVVVDYAHTPDALKKVLQTLREINATQASKLICVFGCGGDRDRGKRAMMGKVAEQFSDHCIVTSDNPRSENPQRIMAEIVNGMRQNNHEIMADRSAAIARAISLADKLDTVLVAGKGHEDYQEISGVKHAFSDVLVAEQALKNWMPEVRA
ncbi:MAG: UDP-N-acetylmuramoyl-L-alanyl-D-glutamate--2,6-diaminopimelate ligase [Gallionella sp.]